MKNYSLTYQNRELFKEFLQNNNIHDSLKILVQVFSSTNQYNFIKSLQTMILDNLPSAKIIGTTTDGEISNQGLQENSTVISISIFKNTQIKTEFVNHDSNSFNSGRKIIENLNIQNSDIPKVIIAFADGLHTNGEDFLDGISSVNSNLIVAGGLAGDRSTFVETFVFNEKAITNNGAVIAALYNKELNVYTDYSFNWKSIGKKHYIEKAEKNRVYQISGMTPVKFYDYYLGGNIAKLLPAVGIEFPLVINKDGINIARAVLAKHDDESLSFAGNIEEGSEVKFGHGDVSMILNNSIENIENILSNPVESIFIYSCMARKTLLKTEVNVELLPLGEVAPISGFFTYGEFYSNCNDEKSSCKLKLLNQTMTILALSESDTLVQKVKPSLFDKNNNYLDILKLHRTQALSELIEKTTNELEDLNLHLENRVKEEVEKSLEKDAIVEANARYAQMGEIIDMIVHQWRQPLSALSTSVSSLQIYKEVNLLTDEQFKETTNKLLNLIEHLNQTIDDFRGFFKTAKTKEHITPKEIFNKANILISSLVDKHEVTLIQDFEFNDSIYVHTSQMMQVILNIIKNGIDAIEENNKKEAIIEIRCFSKENNCIIEIEDNGGGIPKDILPKIFNKRFTTKGESHGTGIGLDMSRTIIESHMNGKLTARNSEKGAVFSISLPLDQN